MAYETHKKLGSGDIYEGLYKNTTSDVYHYYYYDEYVDAEYSDHFYEIFDFEVPIYGYIWPVIVFITASCNVLVIFGFLRKNQLNATNIILVSIAISDSLTGLVTLPATIHVFSMHHFALSKQWCEAVMISRLFVSRAFHSASVWQTLLLAVHRYIQLKDPVKAQQLVTVRKTAVSIAIIYVISFVLHIYHAFDIKTEFGLCHWVIEDPCVETCVYIWLALLFGHLLPCILLLFLTFGMVRRLRMLDRREETETMQQSRKKVEHVEILTRMVIFIVVIFLIPECPYGVFYMITASLGMSGKAILPLNTNRMIHCIYELVMVLSFHFNFWVYLLLIRSFRSSVKHLIQIGTFRLISFKRLEDSSGSEAVELHALKSDTDNTENI